jgi:hypothetical protein
MNYEQAIEKLAVEGFEIAEAPGLAGRRAFASKDHCAVVIQSTATGIRLFSSPGFLIAGQLCTRTADDQLRTGHGMVPATPQQLAALNEFSSELQKVIGL